MFNPQKLIIDHFVAELRQSYQEAYSTIHLDYANVIAWTAQLALENIAASDTLYHNVEHTIMVALVGQAILKGKHLCEGGITPKDWLLFNIALLCHDIGYVKGICRADGNGFYATGIGEETVALPSGGTAAVLQPYHVDRAKLFVRERFGGKSSLFADVDVDIINEYIEMSRFPPSVPASEDTTSPGALIRAADFIGQLGDPNYLRKIPALFYEFEETGTNAEIGYKNPGDMRQGYADFYWKVVSQHIQGALRYLRVTQEGRLWIANLHAHVFDSEHHHTLL